MRAGVGRGGHRAWVGMCVVLVCVGVLTIAGGLGAAPGYPVKVGSTGRHVVDQNGVPFLLIGDSPQGMIANLSLADAEVYFSSRQSYGYNAVQIHLLAGPTFNGRSDFSTQDGITPFTTDGDLSTPREAYFARVDDIVNLAAQHDMLVFLTAAETIDGLTLFKNNGVTKCRAFGQYLGNRYKNYKNIVWNYGNDFQTWRTSDIDVILAVADGINDTAPNHLNTAWLDYLLSASRDSAAFDSRIQLDFVYSYYSTYAKTLDEYSKSPAKPIHLGEANYEEESLRGYLTTPFILRKQNYWAMTSGASGVFSVNGYMWRFEPGWELRLDSTGTQQLAHFINLFSSISWWKLVPDSTHQVMTAGYGTYAALGGINTNDYASAAMTDDGTTMVAYIPTIRTITVDMSRLAGPAIARWYDPSNGASVAIPGSPLPNTGMLSFTPPGNNADGPGNEDWVLVLEVFAAGGPSLAVRVNGVTFHSGDSLQLDLIVANLGRETVVDFYLGALLPRTAGPGLGCQNGDPIVLLGDSFARVVLTCLSASPVNVVPFARNIVLPAGLPLTTVTILSFNWQPDFPVGPYEFFAALTRADSMEVRTLDVANVTFEP